MTWTTVTSWTRSPDFRMTRLSSTSPVPCACGCGTRARDLRTERGDLPSAQGDFSQGDGAFLVYEVPGGWVRPGHERRWWDQTIARQNGTAYRSPMPVASGLVPCACGCGFRAVHPHPDGRPAYFPGHEPTRQEAPVLSSCDNCGSLMRRHPRGPTRCCSPSCSPSKEAPVMKPRGDLRYPCACGCGRYFRGNAKWEPGWGGYHGPDTSQPSLEETEAQRKRAKREAKRAKRDDGVTIEIEIGSRRRAKGERRYWTGDPWDYGVATALLLAGPLFGNLGLVNLGLACWLVAFLVMVTGPSALVRGTYRIWLLPEKAQQWGKAYEVGSLSEEEWFRTWALLRRLPGVGIERATAWAALSQGDRAAKIRSLEQAVEREAS